MLGALGSLGTRFNSLKDVLDCHPTSCIFIGLCVIFSYRFLGLNMQGTKCSFSLVKSVFGFYLSAESDLVVTFF